MKVFELLNKHKNEFLDVSDTIWYEYWEDDIFIKAKNITRLTFAEKCIEFLKMLTTIEPITSDDVIFVLPQLSTIYSERNEDYHSFSCKKSEIEFVINDDFTMWNNMLPNRLEHYAYDFNELNSVLGAEVFYDGVSSIVALAIIVNELFRYGDNEEDRNTNIKNMINELNESINEFEEKKKDENPLGISADEAFKHMEDKILSYASEEEKQEIIKEKEEKKLNKERDNKYFQLTLRINHKRCIAIVEKYYRSTL